jgi:hypothetical protein
VIELQRLENGTWSVQVVKSGEGEKDHAGNYPEKLRTHYSFHRSELRSVRPSHSYSQDEVWDRVAGAVAYHEALSTLYGSHIESHSEPVMLDLHPGRGGAPGERAVTIIREGYGVVGVQAKLTRDEIAAGRIM